MPDAAVAQFLYLTTIGRRTGLPREIEIWFVTLEGRYYVVSELMRRANWVRNIQRNPRVSVRIGTQTFAATARVLDPKRDRELYRAAQEASRRKYEWGDGWPVELTPDTQTE